MLMPFIGISINTLTPQKQANYVENRQLNPKMSETFKFVANTKERLVSNVDEPFFI